MALKAGRVGVLPSEVDINGRIKGGGSDISDVVLELGTNTDGDPIINLKYNEGDEIKNSPVSFDKNSFDLVNNHLTLKSGGGGATTPTSVSSGTKNYTVETDGYYSISMSYSTSSGSEIVSISINNVVVASTSATTSSGWVPCGCFPLKAGDVISRTKTSARMDVVKIR